MTEQEKLSLELKDVRDAIRAQTVVCGLAIGLLLETFPNDRQATLTLLEETEREWSTASPAGADVFAWVRATISGEKLARLNNLTRITVPADPQRKN